MGKPTTPSLDSSELEKGLPQAKATTSDEKSPTCLASSGQITAGLALMTISYALALDGMHAFRQFRDGNYCHAADNNSGVSCIAVTAWGLLVINDLLALGAGVAGVTATAAGVYGLGVKATEVAQQTSSAVSAAASRLWKQGARALGYGAEEVLPTHQTNTQYTKRQ